MGRKIVITITLFSIYFPFILMSNFFSIMINFCISRPKQVKDVAHQEEVIRVLTNTLETGSVIHRFLTSFSSSLLKTLIDSLRSSVTVSSHALLRSSRHRENHYCPRYRPSTFRVSLSFPYFEILFITISSFFYYSMTLNYWFINDFASRLT